MNKSSLKINQHGFTAIELVITVLIIGVVSAFAIPGFNAMINNQALTATSNEIVSAMQTARSEAIKRSGNVTVCFESTKVETTGECKNVGDANAGIKFLYIFIDADNNETKSAAEELLYQSSEFNHKIKFKHPSVLKNTITSSIRFNSKGNIVFDGALGKSRGIIGICDERNSNASSRAIILNTTGRATSSKNVTPFNITC